MANKEKIEYLLHDIESLHKQVKEMHDAEIYPASFFKQTFDITYKLLKDLHYLEADQICQLQKQMEEHQALIQTIPVSAIEVTELPDSPALSEFENKEKEEVIIQNSAEDIKEVAEAITEITETVIEATEQIEEKVLAEENEPIQKELIPTMERNGLFLNDLLEKKNLSDFKKAFSLNDRFRFKRELFGGNEELMNETISTLNLLQSYNDSIAYIQEHFQWNQEDSATIDFIKLLEKRFL